MLLQYLRNPIHTTCVGQAASMASLLLTAGEPKQRRSLPNSRIMLHQPSGGASVRICRQHDASDVSAMLMCVRGLQDRNCWSTVIFESHVPNLALPRFWQFISLSFLLMAGASERHRHPCGGNHQAQGPPQRALQAAHRPADRGHR